MIAQLDDTVVVELRESRVEKCGYMMIGLMLSRLRGQAETRGPSKF